MSSDKDEAKDAFKEIAGDKTTLDKDQVIQCLELLGHVPEPEVSKGFKNGTDFDTFFGIMLKVAAEGAGDASTTLEKVWKTFDPEDEGAIKAGDLLHLLTAIGNPLPKEQVEEAIKNADENNDGYISRAEMLGLLQGQE